MVWPLYCIGYHQGKHPGHPLIVSLTVLSATDAGLLSKKRRFRLKLFVAIANKGHNNEAKLVKLSWNE